MREVFVVNNFQHRAQIHNDGALILSIEAASMRFDVDFMERATVKRIEEVFHNRPDSKVEDAQRISYVPLTLKKTGTNMIDFDVGARLKAVRKARKMSQRELATQSGVTNGLISLIEGNKSSPSISSLKKILSVFNMTLSDFFDAAPIDTEKFAFRFAELTEINPQRVFHEGAAEGLKAVSLRRVGSSHERSLLMLYEIYEPGADTGPEQYAHEGEEGGFVIEGELTLYVGDTAETLQAGDAYQFESTKPHRFRNLGDKRCVVVSACTPPTF